MAENVLGQLTESRGTNEDTRCTMHITDIMRADSPTFSFEFFPPRTPEAAEILYQTIRDLESYMPHFISVTYGAGGSTRDLTHDLVERIQHTTKLDPIPHLTCVCHNEEEIEAILHRYAKSAIGNILALGGDRPRDVPYDKARDSFQHAVDLVKFIRRFNESGAHPDRRGFGIGVAGFPEGHPATPNRLVEMDHLKAKVDAGGDYMVTQLFFDNRDFFDFRERCTLAGIHVPIIAGIMPITSMSGFKRIAELAGGARFPAKLLRALQRCENDPEMVRRVGVHFALEQCHDLLDNNVAGIHFYTLNRSDATRVIFDSLGIPRRRSAQISAV
jgi:methylenetetrahydrofolate reductase (NADPH)